MKVIGFLNSVTSWGGGEKWHYDTAAYFAQKSYEVHFFLTRGSALHLRLQQVSGIHLHFVHIDGLSFLNPVRVKKLQKKFLRTGLNVLLINLSNDLKIGGRAAKAAGVDKVIYRRAVPVPVKSTGLNRFIFQHWLTGILANSQATKRAILEQNSGLIQEEKIEVIYNPVDAIAFLERPFKKMYQKKPGELVIGSIGRLENEKNHRYLIELSFALNQKNIRHTILLGGTGSRQKELIAFAKQRNVYSNFIFAGFLENVKDLLCCCDVFVFPSLWEGFGFAVTEASLCRLPVIAFNTTSMPEVIENKVTGFLIPENSVEQAVDKLALLNTNHEMRDRMGERGKQFIESKFNYLAIMKQLEAYLFQ